MFFANLDWQPYIDVVFPRFTKEDQGKRGCKKRHFAPLRLVKYDRRCIHEKSSFAPLKLRNHLMGFQHAITEVESLLIFLSRMFVFSTISSFVYAIFFAEEWAVTNRSDLLVLTSAAGQITFWHFFPARKLP